LTNGSIVGFFTKHKFFDFRDLAQYQGAPDPITSAAGSSSAHATSSYFTTEDWTSFWGIQNWNNSGGNRQDATVFMVNSPNNVYIEQNSDPVPASKTWMTLRTLRLQDFQSAAEIESVSRGFKYLSMRMMTRTVGASGGCTAMFTYRDDGHASNVQEADLEIRTREPRDIVQYTNQPSVDSSGNVITAATRNATIPTGRDWSQWAVHRLDWTPTQSTWYVDGIQAANISFQVPRDPSQVIINAWSDGGEWTGNMTVHDEVFMQIQWIELVYNTTDQSPKRRDGLLSNLFARADDGVCKTVCSLDETTKTGTPVQLWSNGAARLSQPNPMLAACLPALIIVISTALLSLGF
jgi:hypothetical protein